MRKLHKVKLAATVKEKKYYREGELGPGVPKRKISPLPKVDKPKKWEFSAHPHHAERSGTHTDIRLGDPASRIAHSFVLPRRVKLPEPGEMARVITAYDHSLPYMNFYGPITTKYGRGLVEKGRRTTAEVYHSEPDDEPGTKLRFNLYEGVNPEEFSIRKDHKGSWFIHNKTQSRKLRPDLPSAKPKYKEISVDEIDPKNNQQSLMPKLDGAHVVVDLKAGRSPRVFSYRKGKKTLTGLIEHTHKMPKLLTKKVPKELHNTLLRAEAMGINNKGEAVPAEQTAGLLNAKVWESRRRQAEQGARLKPYAFDVITHKGKPLAEASFVEKLKVLREVGDALADIDLPEIASTPKEKVNLLNRIRLGKHPLTDEGYVLVDKNKPGVPIKSVFSPDYDVYVRRMNPAISAKTGKPHGRVGSVGYSWTSDGPIVGTLGGFKHDEAEDMLKNPEQYIGRVAKVKARKVFRDKKGDPKALFQPRFKGWHLDKGDIEKAMEKKALVHKDQVRKGTSITDSYDKFVAKLQPGDILLSKASLKGAPGASKLITKFQGLRGLSGRSKDWTHTALYLGDGKLRHAYSGIVGKKPTGFFSTQKVRDHNLNAFMRLGRDVYALRPKLRKKDRLKAVVRSEDMKGKKFNLPDIIRAGLLPKGKAKQETLKENLPDKVICTALLGYSYPKLKFKKKSIHSVMPAELGDHKRLKPVAAFSADRVFKDLAGHLKGIKRIISE